MASRSLQIEVGYDLICPWCLIGKRQLDQALMTLSEQHPDIDVQLQWRPVQLLPHIPAPGVAFMPFYIQRLGSVEAVGMRQAQVRLAAASVGLEINFERIEMMPNTLAAHRWIAFTAQRADQATVERLIERLFRAHFQNGENIGDPAVLDRIGVEQQLARGEADPTFMNAYQGVPCFDFDGRVSLSGAQGADRLLAAIAASIGESSRVAA